MFFTCSIVYFLIILYNNQVKTECKLLITFFLTTYLKTLLQSANFRQMKGYTDEKKTSKIIIYFRMRALAALSLRMWRQKQGPLQKIRQKPYFNQLY